MTLLKRLKNIWEWSKINPPEIENAQNISEEILDLFKTQHAIVIPYKSRDPIKELIDQANDTSSI